MHITIDNFWQGRPLDFAVVYADAGEPLQAWRKVMEVVDYANFAELRQTFRSVDRW